MEPSAKGIHARILASVNSPVKALDTPFAGVYARSRWTLTTVSTEDEMDRRTLDDLIALAAEITEHARRTERRMAELVERARSAIAAEGEP